MTVGYVRFVLRWERSRDWKLERSRRAVRGASRGAAAARSACRAGHRVCAPSALPPAPAALPQPILPWPWQLLLLLY